MTEKANNSRPSKRDNAWWNNRFYTVIISVALFGGGCAFFYSSAYHLIRSW